MKRRFFVASLVAGTMAAPGISLAQSEAGTATPVQGEGDEMELPAEGNYVVLANGLELYYEIHGEGEPLILLHGAYGTIDLWGLILTTLAEHYQVIAVELQGHGHTADIDRPIRYETMADDVAGLMEHLDLAQADIVGYSMGAGVAFRLAIQYPEKVRKLVAISASTNREGVYPEVWEGIAEITPEVFAGSPLEEAYLRNAPNPEDWPVLVEKLVDLDMQEFDWDEEVSQITAPTLLIIGDSDIVKPEHIVEVFRSLGGGVPGDYTGLPNSQLAIIPGATHVAMGVDRAYLWLPMVESFLDAPMPEAE